MTQVDPDAQCPGCGQSIGDHTIRGYAECLKTAGFDYELPHEEIPGGPLQYDGIEGTLAGEVTVASGVINSAIGPFPCLRFTFVAPGIDPMSRVPLPAITLVMDGAGLNAVSRLVRNAVKTAIGASRRV